ncbi:MAG TPA: hypothetical protein VGN17_01620 [Bryobacteraceae bacterium]|jgi:hypothetical protein
MLRRWLILLVAWLPARALANDPAVLQIRILEGDRSVYVLGGRATKGVTVQVTDETGKPVDGVTVSFRLPEDGPGGTFSNNSKTEIATTQADGRAGVWGMQWNKTAGTFEIRIAAVKGQARAGTVCSLYLREGQAPEVGSGHGGHRWLWVALAAAGAAGGAGIAARGGAGSGGSPASAVNTVRIGTPTISLGHP